MTTAEPIGADDSPVLDPRGVDDVLQTGEGEQTSESEIEGDGSRGTTGGASGSLTTCVESLDSSLGALGFILGVVVLSALVFYRFNFAIALLFGWTLLPPVMFVYFLITDCTVSGSTFGGGGSGLASSQAGEGLIPAGELPPSIVVGSFVILLVGAAVVMYRSADEEDTVAPQEESDPDTPELDRFAEAAGEAADRIEERNVDVDNSVYRAWLEMTGLLDVDAPDTYTAEEFAEAAVDVGMDADNVEELTELFNEVRYGAKDVDQREDRAIEILRTIESEYSSDETSTDDESGDSSGHEDDNGGDTV
ncbi:DUF4129 domain-containing protein [Halobacteria archaeon AArc-m2/3/4]|uniref:DUF4129 domain-containing protein n=1 Tax=Natronoglomus mannanivorans TaxID=2979990 RepID=A0ABT2QGK3_9EURY|nr:DUF4129 domain-containing protein [Halobacteria archaeon AArc-m2/3/4]